jgi:hypothetical protein
LPAVKYGSDLREPASVPENTAKNSCSNDPSLPMNSPPEKQRDKPNAGDQNPAKSPREMIEQVMAQTVMEVIQLRRTLWLIVKQVGGKVILDEELTHPLWQMKATRTQDKKLQLESIQLPDPTETQLAVVASILDGTRMEVQDAIEHTELNEYPPNYVEKVLKDRVVRGEDGYWVDVNVAKIVAESENTLPGNN